MQTSYDTRNTHIYSLALVSLYIYFVYLYRQTYENNSADELTLQLELQEW